MTTSVRMEMESDTTEKILDLTFEIIYLLTGEDYKLVKKTSSEPLTPNSCLHGPSPNMVPPSHCLMTEVTSAEKILEITKKITELLTGEVSGAGNSGPLSSNRQDGSSNGNLPERYPRPLYSRDYTLEDLTIPHHHQADNINDIKIEVKEEEEETLLSGEQPSIEEEMIMKYKQEESSLHIDTSGLYDWSTSISDGAPMTSSECKSEDDVTAHSPGGRSHQVTRAKHHPHPQESSHYLPSMTSGIHLSSERSTHPSDPKTSSLSPENVHTEESSLSCSECGRIFTNAKALLKHKARHTDERPFSCSECGKCFASKKNLIQHQKLHSNRNFPCSECGKCFINNNALLSHKISHTGERPFSCSECGKCYALKGNLKKHQKIHTGVRPFSCSECGKSFTQKEHLLTHQRSHTGERPYSCSVCGKCFAAISNLVKHQKIHTGKRPFSCSVCGKCFTHKHDLLIHEKIHTGERPYKCSECEKCFSSKANLLGHQARHTGTLPFSCSDCGKHFSQKKYLQRHKKNSHS